MKNIVSGEFTQEVKDAWIKALESGEYIQTDGTLVRNNKHCCIGVLGEIHKDLNNKINRSEKNCPYLYLDSNNIDVDKLYAINDDTFDESKPDYSNVLPLIKSLPVKS